jgi:hypothetical protein
VEERRLSCCCSSCQPVALPCQYHSGGPAPAPGQPSVPALIRVDTYPQTFDHRNRIEIGFSAPGLSFVQVLWGPKGGAATQYKIDVTDGNAYFTAEPAEPGATYTVQVQGCLGVLLSPSNCSPWSFAIDVTATENLHSVLKFLLEVGTLFEVGDRYTMQPSPDNPISLRSYVQWSQIAPSDGYHNVPGLRTILGV